MPQFRVTRERELTLLSTYERIGGMDEVGRGCLAGPVTVGLSIIDATTSDHYPPTLADSKQLSARRREELCEPIRQWTRATITASASPQDIDARGIIGALRLAGRRALAHAQSMGLMPDVVLLDGTHDWLTPPSDDLFSDFEDEIDTDTDLWGPCDLMEALPACAVEAIPPVITQVKADATCAVVAAASVVAKVERDAFMVRLADPGYGWASNKGYASPSHQRALAQLGPSDWHRLTWSLPGCATVPRRRECGMGGVTC